MSQTTAASVASPRPHLPSNGRRTPVSTYRLQLGPDLSFDQAAAQLDYFEDLGVTDLYLSPILQAAPGSTHGYDVVDHSRISAEMGGREGFERLATAAHEHAVLVAGLGGLQGITDLHGLPREGALLGGGGAGVADLVTALAELQDLDVDDAQAAVDQMDEDQMKAVRSHPQVKLKIAEIQKRRLEVAAKTAPSLGDLMAGLVKKD